MRNLVIAFICLLLAIPCPADIITVDDDGPADFNNIQAAIDAAVDGDEVVVADGVYTGEGNRDIDFKGKAITVRSENGPENCIIDCQGSKTEPHRGFNFHSGEGIDSVLDGFTITNGFILDTYGGAIRCKNSSPTIKNCIISNNKSKASDDMHCGHGGGVYTKSSNAVIMNCVFEDNMAYSEFAYGVMAHGGGIYNIYGSPRIISCKFIRNSGSWGGGVANESSYATYENCIFEENVTEHLGGGAFNVFGGNINFTNCVFIRNRTFKGDTKNGGACWSSRCYTKFANCTIVENFRSAICMYPSQYGRTRAIIKNCIIWNNERSIFLNENAGGIPVELTVSYSDIQGGYIGEGNIDANPLLATDGYHLLAGSPCINTGDPSGDYNGQTDIDGWPRVTGSRVDIGADEFGDLVVLAPNGGGILISGDTYTVSWERREDTAEILVEYSIDNGSSWTVVDSPNAGNSDSYNWLVPRVNSNKCLIRVSDAFDPNIGDISDDVFTIIEADANDHVVPVHYTTIQAAIDDCNEGDTVIVAPKIYTGVGNHDIDFGGKAITVRSMDLEDINIVNSTIINGNGTGSIVTFANAEGPDAVLTGFTITGAETGIYCCNASPTIANCNISENRAEGIRLDSSFPIITDCTIDGNGGIAIGLWRGSDPIIINCTIVGDVMVQPIVENLTEGKIYYYIQDAIGDANNSVEIVVRQGTCHENIDFAGKNLVIKSKDPNDPDVIASTVIDGGHQGLPVVTFSGGEEPNCVLAGFTITGGSDGIYCSNASPKITNCDIIENVADGISLYDESQPTITNCIVADNGGVGIQLLDGSYGSIANCIITDNGADGIYYEGDSLTTGPTITNCIIAENKAAGAYFNISRASINNCTISGNGAEGIGFKLSFLTITNCILWDNLPPQILKDGQFGAATVSYSDIQGGWDDGQGNIDADPCFVAPGYWADISDPNIIVEPNDPNAVWIEGDYHLWEGSPCINAGDPNYIAGPDETDLDGLPRIIGGRIDMGAYEFNYIPVADAGPNQVAYAWIDDIAEVTLDGNDSYDPDGDELTYFWNWAVDGNTYEANGVGPTIELPVGEHIIELVVNDGIDDSELSESVVTVIGPMYSHLWLSPQVIHRHSFGPKRIMALVSLPRGITKNHIDESELLRLYYGDTGIEAVKQHIFNIGPRRRRGKYAIIFAAFDKAELLAAIFDSGRLELQAVGMLKTGRYFYGFDTIRIKRHPRWPWRRRRR